MTRRHRRRPRSGCTADPSRGSGSARPGVPSPIPVMGQRYILIEGAYDGVGSWTYDPMGLRGASNGGVTFENVRVPKENAVGAEPDPMVRSVASKGNSVFSPHLISMGCAGAALEAAVHHARRASRSG